MDLKMFRAINRLAGRSFLLDNLMILISNRIRYVYILIMIIMWFKKRTYKKMTIEAIISMLITLIIHFFINLFYFKPRPFLKRRVRVLFPSKKNSSFPSKHTLIVFAVSTTVWYYKRTLGIIMSAMSLLTGVSRIWIGHHYPIDIAGSAILGSFISMLIHKISRFLIKRT